MDYRQDLIGMIDKFNIESVEEFKEAEMKIIQDSKFSNMFKKKDYDSNIRMLKSVKKHALAINPKSVKIPDSDENTKELLNLFQRCLVVFNSVCDTHIQLQLSLKKKAEGEALNYKDYRKNYDKVRSARAKLNSRLHEMDILYSDYADIEREEDGEEDLAGIKYMTYDSIK